LTASTAAPSAMLSIATTNASVRASTATALTLAAPYFA
jgi:hypothetical protein